MTPGALTITASALVFARLAHAGHFDARLFLPFALGSVPAAYFGGAYPVTDAAHKYIAGAACRRRRVLRLFQALARCTPAAAPRRAGARRGPRFSLAGLTAARVDGGSFSLLLALRWMHLRSNAAIAAAFVLNPVDGLAQVTRERRCGLARRPVPYTTA